MSDTKNSETCPGDSVPRPSWIDESLIEESLRNRGEVNPEIQAFTVFPAVAAGLNYASTIYRLKATLSDGKECSFIIKGPPNGEMANLSKESFQREIIMLTDCIPKMQVLLEEAAPGRFPPLAPRCFHHGTSPVAFLVLEDLNPSGFKLGDRKRGLGLRHSLLALRSLARFHAASYALLKRQPDLVDKLDNLLRSDNQGQQDFVQGELQALAMACRSWPGFEECAERLEKLKSVIGGIFDKLNEPKTGAFSVIAHGDFWVNNLMFRYEDGKPKEFRAVDLQLAHVCSPVIDILHLFSNSVTENVYEHHQDLLLREYHVELKTTLELLGHQALPLELLRSAMDAHGTYALYSALEIPIVKADRGVDLNAICRGELSQLLQLLESPDTKTKMQRILKEYARKGWLPA